MIERIAQFIQNQRVSVRAFEQSIGASDGMIRRAINNGTDIQSKWLAAIADNYPNLSIDWLITGRGSMLKEEYTQSMEDRNTSQVQILHHPKVADKVIEQQSIPVYDVEAAANLKTVFDNKTQNILGEITMPNIPRCDGAIYVRGDSMYPLLKSGDIVGYKEIFNFENVIYGEMYIVAYDIEGDEFVCVKYVNHSERDRYIKLVSYNPHHDPKDIPVERISAMALVKFSIRMNTII